ncbi:hypothetical protein COV13_02150 [Candidatus Woesearchaeota archaeon CG10_big_fil_rev_8_21_14_0_10_32_9]|nr:MAG: hypothetical protein COV13_02150 [Candidatus Woesearchaeota archaeon CG10_big_fil_rev_8_21_14_0_10_32_9]
MHLMSHLAYPYILLNLFAGIVGGNIPIEYVIVFVFFSVLPDFDYLLDLIRQKTKRKKYEVPGHHHSWPSHWPIVYSPLILVAAITQDAFFILAAIAVFIHLAMDMFFCNEGVMFFYPFSKKWYNFFAENTKGKEGLDWNKAYNKLVIHKFDWIATIFVLIHFFVIYIF